MKLSFAVMLFFSLGHDKNHNGIQLEYLSLRIKFHYNFTYIFCPTVRDGDDDWLL